MLTLLTIIFAIRACFTSAYAIAIALGLFGKKVDVVRMERKSYAPMLDILMVFALIIPISSEIFRTGDLKILYHVPVLIAILSIPWLLLLALFWFTTWLDQNMRQSP